MADNQTLEPIPKAPPHPVPGPGRGRSALIAAVESIGNAEGMIVCLSVRKYRVFELKLGLAGTDVLMTALSEKLAKLLPANAVCARLTDSTFGMLLPGFDRPAARKLIREIVDSIASQSINVGTHSIRATCNAGVASVMASRSGADLIETAFSATRRPVFIAPVDKSRKVRKTPPEKKPEPGRRKSASIEYRLSLAFQPIVHLHGERTQLYELFLAFKTPDGERPKLRNLAATATGMDVALDMWAVDRAVDIVHSRLQAGFDTRLFVKLSGQCITDIRVPLAINRALRSRSLPKENLIIEVSENSVSSEPRKAQAFFQSLANAGCLVAVSNFGPSMSEFELLEGLPVAFIKLNKLMIDQVADNEYAVVQLAKICARAEAMQINTIAPNVDDSASLARLFQAGVEFAQGLQIQEPRSTMDFAFDVVIA